MPSAYAFYTTFMFMAAAGFVLGNVAAFISSLARRSKARIEGR